MLSENDNSIAMKLQRVKKWIAFYLVFALLLGFVPINSQVYANTNESNSDGTVVEEVTKEVEASAVAEVVQDEKKAQNVSPEAIEVESTNNRVRDVEGNVPNKEGVNLKLAFIGTESNSLTYNVEEDRYHLEPELLGGDNNTIRCSSFPYRLQLSVQDDITYGVGEIEIHLPKYFFKSRDNKPSGKYKIGIPKNGSREGFQYEEVGEDIVISNIREVGTGTNFYCDITYQCDVYSDIQNEAISNIQGKVILGKDKNQEVISNILQVQYHSSWEFEAINNLYSIDYGTVKLDWDKYWGEPIENVEDYIFVEWRVETKIKRNQQCEILYNSKFDQDGKVLFYCTQGLNYIKVDGGSNNYVNTVLTEGDSQPWYRVIVMYPKPSVETEYTMVTNVTITGRDDRASISAEDDPSLEVKENVTYFPFLYGGGTQEISEISSQDYFFDVFRKTNVGEWIKGFQGTTMAEVQRWDLTKKDNGKDDNYNDFGHYSYTVEVMEEAPMLGDLILNEDEYEFKEGILNYVEYNWKYNSNQGRWETEYRENEEISIPVVEYQVGKNGIWTVADSDREYIHFPDGVTGVRVRATSNSYKKDIKLNLKINVKMTDRIKQYIEDKEDLPVIRVNSLRVLDKEGRVANTVNKSSAGMSMVGTIQPFLPFFSIGVGQHYNSCPSVLSRERYRNISEYLKKLDSNRYNEEYYIMHGVVAHLPTALTKEIKLRVGHSQEGKTYTYNISTLVSGTITEPGLVGGEHVEKLPKGREIYHILLPKGGEIETAYKLQCKEYKIEKNWKNSGRTMLTVKEPSGDISIPVYYSDIAYVNYGKSLYLNVAYENLDYHYDNPAQGKTYDQPQYIGYDIGETESAEEFQKDVVLMSDLNESDAPKMLYAKHRIILDNREMAGTVEAKLLVRGEDSDYTTIGQVSRNSYYKYCISPKASNQVYSIKDLVVYNMLETAGKDRENRGEWKGEFVDIDVSYAEMLGIKPVIYYTTDETIIIDKEHRPDLQKDTRWKSWETDAPADPSVVKGVAIDLSRKIDGTNYILEDEQGIPIYITMKAPTSNAEQGFSGNIYNCAWYSGVEILKQPVQRKGKAQRTVLLSTQESQMYSMGETELQMKLPNLTIKIDDFEGQVVPEDIEDIWDMKRGDYSTKYPDWKVVPAGGRNNRYEHKDWDWSLGERPDGTITGGRNVWGGSKITYRVSISNLEKYDLYNVQVEDIIPEGLSFDPDKVIFKDQDGNLIGGTAYIDEQNPRKLICTIDKLNSSSTQRMSYMYIYIPTTVDYLKEERVIENSIKVTRVEDVMRDGIESDKVTSRINPSQKRNIIVNKVWVDGDEVSSHSSIKVDLLQNGEYRYNTLELSETNNWIGSFEDFPVFDSVGNKIVYTVKEKNIPEDYVVKVTGDMDTGFTVTNFYNKRTIPVLIQWENEDELASRPQSVTVKLTKDGKEVSVVDLSQANEWLGQLKNVVKYDAMGNESVYTASDIQVTGVPSNYTTVVTGDMVTGFTITNTYKKQVSPVIEEKPSTSIPMIPLVPAKPIIPVTPIIPTIPEVKEEPEVVPTRTITVIKEWNDNNNQRKQRPKNVTIQLLANGKKVGKTLMLSEGNHWSSSFKGLLQKDSFGKIIMYTIEEVPVPHYVSNITGNMQDGFVVTNTNRDTDTEITPKEEQKPSEPTTSEPITSKKDKPNLELELNKKKNKPIDVDSPRMRREVLKNIELFLQGQRGDKLGELEIELLRKQGIEVPTSGRMTREVLRQIEMFIQGIRGGELEPMNVQSQQGLQDNSKLVVKTYDAMKLGMYSVGFVSAGIFIVGSIWKRKKKK